MHYFPEYCTTIDEAEECSDAIAENYDLDSKTILSKNKSRADLCYENELIRMVIGIFHDNWKGQQDCYSFKLITLVRKDGDVKEGLPFQRMKQGHLLRQEWRKKPDYFSSDIRKVMRTLESTDHSGRVKGMIFEWRGGYGFARTTFVAKVFVLLKDIPKKFREGVRVGTELRFMVKATPKGPRAAEIEVIGQKKPKEATNAATQTEQEIAAMNAYKIHKDIIQEGILEKDEDINRNQTSMEIAYKKALSRSKKDK